MKIINPNIEILSEYINTKKKILCKCKIDSYIWSPIPETLLKGHGCPKCAGNVRTHDEFIKDMNKINPNIEILENYINTESKIEYRCHIDGYIGKATPHMLLSGRGCPVCSRKKLTHDVVEKELYLANPGIELIGKYVNKRTKIKVRCKIHDVVWDGYFENLKRGKGCCICKKEKLTLSEKLFIDRLSPEKKSEYELVNYTKYSNPITIKHLICGNVFTVTAINFENGLGCPLCYGRERNTELFIKEVQQVWGEDYQVLGDYINDKSKIKVKHNKCGHEYEVRPTSLLKGYGCLKCQESKGEKEISKYLDEKKIIYKIEYKFDKCRYKKPLPFDFYLPKYNMCIEYQGEQHYISIEGRGGKEKLKSNQIRDNLKKVYCENNNIRLLEIPFWDFKNIREILDNIFSN